MSDQNLARLRIVDSVLFVISPVMFLIYLVLLSNLKDILDRLVSANAGVVFQTISAVTDITDQAAVYAALAAGLLLAVSLARQTGGLSWRSARFVPAALFALALFFFFFVMACTGGNRLFPGQALCQALPIGGSQFYPTLVLSMLVMALALPRSQVGRRASAWAFWLLTVLVLHMTLQLAYTFAWAAAVWSVPQAQIGSLAQAANRQLWFPGDWHWLLALGVGAILICTLVAARAVWQGLAVMTGRMTELPQVNS